MKLEIQSIADAGNLEKERLVLSAGVDLDTGDYAVFEARALGSAGVTSKVYGAYWFPDVEIAAGDLVVLYTKAGKQKTKDLRRGRKAYFLYWGATDAKWANDERAPVLLEIRSWMAHLKSDTEDSDE